MLDSDGTGARLRTPLGIITADLPAHQPERAAALVPGGEGDGDVPARALPDRADTIEPSEVNSWPVIVQNTLYAGARTDIQCVVNGVRLNAVAVGSSNLSRGSEASLRVPPRCSAIRRDRR